MSKPQGLSEAPDYRSRLYDRYVSQQLATDVQGLRKIVESGLPYYRRLVDRHMPRNRDARILDLGCGYGPLLYEMKRVGFTNVSGVDISQEQVHVAHKLGLDCVHQGNLLESLTAVADESVDVVAAIDILEHFTKDETLVLLDQIYRVLRIGGTLVLHVPNGEAIFAGKIFFGDLTHQTAYTHKSMRQVALACGFTSVCCYEDTPIPHGVVSSLRSVLWRLVRTTFRIINAIETGDSGTDLVLSQNLLAICRK